MCTNKGKKYENDEKLGISDGMSMVFNFPHNNNGSKFVISMLVNCCVDLFIANLEVVLYLHDNYTGMCILLLCSLLSVLHEMNMLSKLD